MLVTVIIFSYNNLKYLRQAIDSVLMQDYEQIQLIVSDDGSAHFDQQAVRQYIERKKRDNIKEYLVRTNGRNLGTVRHVNRALFHMHGAYLVNLAADDVLYDAQVISNYVRYYAQVKDPDTLVLTQVQHYSQDMREKLYDVLTPERIRLLEYGSMPQIYGELCQWCFIPEAGTALPAELIHRLGGFDERYDLVEDWPFFLKAVRQGVKFRYFDTVSEKHRNGGVSHSSRKRGTKTQNRYYKDLLRVNRYEILKYYRLAPENLQKKIYTMAKDRLVIYECRNMFWNKSAAEKTRWLLNNPNLPMVLARGIKRKIIRGFYERCLKRDYLQ